MNPFNKKHMQDLSCNLSGWHSIEKKPKLKNQMYVDACLWFVEFIVFSVFQILI